MKVSVIIPAYNVEKFIEKSVLSAINQKFVYEVIIIDDNSTDSTLEKAARLSFKHDKVIVLKNYSGVKGSAVARNIGIKAAKAEYIAFLDADDYYFENRFLEVGNVFSNNPEADGVYENVEVEFKDLNQKTTYRLWQGEREMVGIKQPISPEQLFYSMLKGKNGWIHLNGFCIKKKSLDKIDLFDEDLLLTQDIDFILRCALKLKLIEGKNSKSPVASRVIHGDNIIFDVDKLAHYRFIYSKKWFNLMLKNKWSRGINYCLIRNFIISHRMFSRGHIAKKYLFFVLDSYKVLKKYPNILSKLIIG